MSREWEKFENDELFALWRCYKACEFPEQSYIASSHFVGKKLRLSPMEIIKLVDELIKRLEVKDETQPT